MGESLAIRIVNIVMKSAKQAPLFDEPTPVNGAELLRIDQSSSTLNPAQRTFNRLTEQIARARAKLTLWEVMADRLQQRVGGEMQPGLDALKRLQRQLVGQIDEILSHPPAGLKLTRRRREGLTDFMLERIDDLLSHGPDETLEAIHDHYSDLSLQDRRELDQGFELEMAETMVSHMYGDEILKDHGAESVEELLRRVDERIAERAQAGQSEREAAQKRKRKPSRREAELAAQRAEAAQAAGQSLRDVYRKLVSSLHPDRESDPDERARKTALMKDINRAYENQDLLSLLTLQMEVEQISASSLAALPEQRLAHYNDVLREQLKTLQSQIDSCTQHMQLAFDLEPGRRLREPKDAERFFNQQLRELRGMLAQYEVSIASLANARLRLAEIDAIVASMR